MMITFVCEKNRDPWKSRLKIDNVVTCIFFFPFFFVFVYLFARIFFGCTKETEYNTSYVIKRDIDKNECNNNNRKWLG